MGLTSAGNSKRYYSVDSLKFFAAFAVVSIHVYSDELGKVYGELWHNGYMILDQLSRWAVPFFFAVSGYFFAKSLEKSSDGKAVLIKYLRRILGIWLIWSLFYLLWPGDLIPTMMSYDNGFLKAFYWHILKMSRMFSDPLKLMLTGGYFHLWYLPAAAWGLAVVFFAPRKWVWLLALSLYIVCLWQTYVGESYPVQKIGFFFSPVFVLVGWTLARRPLVSFRDGIIWTMIGLAMCAFEIFLVQPQAGLFKGSQYLLGLIPLVTGLLTIALNRPDWGKNTVGKFGVYALGIYILHPAVIDNTIFLAKSPILFLFWPVLVFGMTWGFVHLMSLHPKLRALIT